MTELAPLDRAVLPAGIRSRFVPGINGLRVHVLEAGFEQRGRPCVLLLHGFPEIAYSWRRIMPALAAAGFHVVAPDQRGYGRTTGWDADYDGDLRPFRILNAVRDALGLVSALGYWLGRGGRRPRFRRRGGRLVRAGAARRVPLAGADERAVFRSTRPALRHRRGATAGRRAGRGHPRGLGQARPAAQALPMVLLDPTGQCRDVALPAGGPRLSARLFPFQERRLGRQSAAPAAIVERRRIGQDADLLHHGFRPEHGRDRGAGDAVGGRDRGLPMAARARACGLRRRIRQERVSGRAQLVSLPHVRALRRRIAAVLRPYHRCAVDVHRRRAATGAPISAPALSSACKAPPAPGCGAFT